MRKFILGRIKERIANNDLLEIKDVVAIDKYMLALAEIPLGEVVTDEDYFDSGISRVNKFVVDASTAFKELTVLEFVTRCGECGELQDDKIYYGINEMDEGLKCCKCGSELRLSSQYRFHI